jgi:branched-chain amino acid transport system ATP-binding protein
MSPLLRTDGLCAGYSGVAVVRDLALEVEAGEVVALLGPNGSGKTTTLSVLAGLRAPLAGSVELLATHVARFGAGPAAALARSGVATVPEDRALFLDLTVVENLRLAAAVRRPDLSQVLELFPKLAPLRRRRVATLSGGEQQMLAVARALIRRPRLLLIDELSLGLAPIVVQELLPTLRMIADSTSCGVLLVEQHAQLALDVADRAYVLNHGDVVLAGPSAELRADSAALRRAYLG